MALALQFVLAFAHIHAEDFDAAHGSVAISAPGANADHPTGTAHDDCSICATIQLLRSAVDSTPPLLTLPAFVVYDWTPQAGTDAVALFTLALFRARAPPLA